MGSQNSKRKDKGKDKDKEKDKDKGKDKRKLRNITLKNEFENVRSKYILQKY